MNTFTTLGAWADMGKEGKMKQGRKEEARSGKEGWKKGREDEANDRMLVIRELKVIFIPPDERYVECRAALKKLTKVRGQQLHREELHRLVEGDSYQ